MAKNIFLIGYMGSGKTTWGKKLAHRTNLPFVDLDAALVQHFQMSINDYFEKHGVDAFRLEEQKMLHKVSEKQGQIIACGGGTPCYHNNIDWMNEHGMTIYFSATAEQLHSRLKKDRSQRPLLKDEKEANLLGPITLQLERRVIDYSKAKWSIDAFNLNATKLNALIDYLKEINAL
ncbi:shikimate kinase [bacterium SCSIO 12741]|nr:shikimate kinase [bacterium SCSIO 12741]